MYRRTALRSIAGGVALGLSGCLARKSSTSPGEEGTNGTPETTDTTDRDSTPKTGSKPRLVNRSFTVISGNCGKGNTEAHVSFDKQTVRVRGTIRGQNSCYTAELKSATLEGETLTVNVRSFEDGSTDLCSMCLKEIEYKTTCTFENELPDRVIVLHNDTEITKKNRT